MLTKLDWKFCLTLVVGVAAIAIPYLWQTDSASHALTLRLASSTALQPLDEPRIQDLQVTLNGKKIDSPYISSIVLTNTGTKPIVKSDFERPLEIGIQGATLITAQITGSEPADIPVKIQSDGNRIQVMPFLSNAKDQVSISIVTSGSPTFVPRARIAEIKTITFEDLTNIPVKSTTIAFTAILALMFGSLYAFFVIAGFISQPLTITPSIRIIVCLCLSIACVSLALDLINQLGGLGTSAYASVIGLVVLSFTFAYGIARQNESVIERHALR